MKRNTYLIAWHERQASSGFSLSYGTCFKSTWNSALKKCMDVLRERVSERGVPYTEAYKNLVSEDKKHKSGKLGFENAYDVRIDFTITHIVNPDSAE